MATTQPNIAGLHVNDNAIDQVADDAGMLQKLENAFKTILQCVGENIERPGIVKTPRRAAEAFLYFTKGYQENIKGSWLTIPLV